MRAYGAHWPIILWLVHLIGSVDLEAQHRGELPPARFRPGSVRPARRAGDIEGGSSNEKIQIAARREIAVKAIAVGLSAIVSIGIGFAAAQNKDSRESQPLMHIHNLYADANGETHFRDTKIEPAT